MMNLRDQIKDDMDLIFDTEELAVPGLWKRDGEESVTVNGIFDSTIKLSNGATVGSAKADAYNFNFIFKSEDAEGIAMGDSITIGTVDYFVAVDPVDTYGFTQLILNESL